MYLPQILAGKGESAIISSRGSCELWTLPRPVKWVSVALESCFLFHT